MCVVDRVRSPGVWSIGALLRRRERKGSLANCVLRAMVDYIVFFELNLLDEFISKPPHRSELRRLFPRPRSGIA